MVQSHKLFQVISKEKENVYLGMATPFHSVSLKGTLVREGSLQRKEPECLSVGEFTHVHLSSHLLVMVAQLDELLGDQEVSVDLPKNHLALPQLNPW